ncbi:MAG: hypothetical protein FI718_02725 [SAR202 cluster bacterium]|nr:hypothetical protein [SAR202 cluster bacterium]|tara:strand:- start:329 stop:754 length:426 start_codon:yes stop_codon:yes gene_type:complete
MANNNKENESKKRIIEGLEILVDEAKSAAKSAIRKTGADSIGENLKESVESVLAAREKVVMVRLNKESLMRIDELVESQLVKSRSEAAAFLIGEGIQRRNGLFDRIAQKVDNIRKAKEELHNLLSEEESLNDLDTNNSKRS